LRARRWKKANIHKRCRKFHFALTVISLESVRNAFSADVCEWFLALDWIIHQRVLWEQNIRYIYLPSLQLSIIMWLSHLLTSFSEKEVMSPYFYQVWSIQQTYKQMIKNLHRFFLLHLNIYTVYIHNGTFPLKYALRDTLGISNGSFVMKRMSTSGKAT
jgi:hypothetical protein